MPTRWDIAKSSPLPACSGYPWGNVIHLLIQPALNFKSLDMSFDLTESNTVYSRIPCGDCYSCIMLVVQKRSGACGRWRHAQRRATDRLPDLDQRALGAEDEPSTVWDGAPGEHSRAADSMLSGLLAGGG